VSAISRADLEVCNQKALFCILIGFACHSLHATLLLKSKAQSDAEVDVMLKAR
jgi:hypothetical protein